jgi:hypothetical protein
MELRLNLSFLRSVSMIDKIKTVAASSAAIITGGGGGNLRKIDPAADCLPKGMPPELADQGPVTAGCSDTVVLICGFKLTAGAFKRARTKARLDSEINPAAANVVYKRH